MGFSQMMELLQSKEKGRIVFCNIGEFYVAIGKDAVLLNEILGLKVTCLKLEVCKVGFPIKSLEKYTELLIQKRYGFIVYYFNKESKELEILESYMGKNINTITEPKLRKIEKSRYIDRIVHRWVVDNFLEPAFVPQFVSSSYACLKNKGMHRAALHVQNKMKHCKTIWKEYYILKMDVSKYFDNINKNILLNILKRKIKDKDLLWLIKEILYAQKREKGLEIGNYTSQMFANIYLNEVDQYIKHKLKVKYYCRYLDDSVIIVKTKKEAKEILEKIRKFLKENLELELNKKTQIFKSKQGVNFCGYKINEYRMKIRDKGKRKLKKKIKHLKHEIKEGEMTSKEAKKYLAGHMGYIKYANVNNLLEKLFYIDK